MSRQEKEPTGFDAYAAEYAELIRDPIRDKFASGSVFFAQRKVEIMRSYCLRTGIRQADLDWLDIGCGQGELLRLGQSFFRSAAGCDPSKAMLESCRGLNTRHQESLEALPFDDGSFDFITVVCVYHHVLPERRAALTREGARVLRPGGTFCIIEHNPLNPVTKLIVSRTPVDRDARLLRSREAERLLRDAGCERSATRFFLLFPELLHRWSGRVEDALSRLPLGGQYAVFGVKASEV